MPHPGKWKDGTWTIRCRHCKATRGAARVTTEDGQRIVTCQECGREFTFSYSRTPCGWVKRHPRLIRRIALCQRKQGGTLPVVAAVFGVSGATVVNWQNKERAPKLLKPRRSPYPLDAVRRVVARVKAGERVMDAARAEGLGHAPRTTIHAWLTQKWANA